MDWRLMYVNQPLSLDMDVRCLCEGKDRERDWGRMASNAV